MQENDTGQDYMSHRLQPWVDSRLAMTDADSLDGSLLSFHWPPRSCPEPLHRTLGDTQVSGIVIHPQHPGIPSQEALFRVRGQGSQGHRKAAAGRHRKQQTLQMAGLDRRQDFRKNCMSVLLIEVEILSWLPRKSQPRHLYLLSRCLLLHPKGVGMACQEGP